ncbi:MAG: PD40 domain-containing protein [Methylococcaceae bacterium]|nr:PD40 domain-containing protein [Methylococcaceae bacterium]
MLLKTVQKFVDGSLIVLLCMLGANAGAGETTRVSLSTSGVEGNASSGNGSSGHPTRNSLSANGRWIAFESVADNLVSGDTNGTDDIFVHDRLTHETTRVSVDSNGGQGNRESYFPSISANGRWVAFFSGASNLVAGDTNGPFGDIFVHDRVTHETERVSVNSNGQQASFGSYEPSISADGRWVAFISADDNLVAGDTNGTYDVFVHDRLLKRTSLVSANSNGVKGNSYSMGPRLSADGRWVTFWSNSDNLVNGDTNGVDDIFLHDRFNHETSRVSINTNGEQADVQSYAPSISANGRWVAFQSGASNLVAGEDNNPWEDIFVHDRVTHETTRVNVDSNGVQGFREHGYPSISADGRWVVFQSWATNLVIGDNNDAWDIFVHDRRNHETTLASVNFNGMQGNSWNQYPSISANGREVTFVSDSSNMVSGDTNDATDIFVYDRTLVNRFQGDLQIETTQQPATLAKGSQGSYTYTITNNGPDSIFIVKVTHLVTNGQVVNFTPSQGWCNRYASISLCNLSRLDSGGSLTLTVNIKAIRNAVSQQVSVSSAARADPQAPNNIVSVETPVTP